MQTRFIRNYSRGEVLDKLYLLRNIDLGWITFNDAHLTISKIAAVCSKFWKCNECIFWDSGFSKKPSDKIIKYSFVAAVVLYSNDKNKLIASFLGIQERSLSTALKTTLNVVTSKGDVGNIIADIFYELHRECPSRLDNLFDDDIVGGWERYLNRTTRPSNLEIQTYNWFVDNASADRSILAYRIGDPAFCKKTIPSKKNSTALYSLQGCGYRFIIYEPFTNMDTMSIRGHSYIRGTYHMTTACLTCPLYRECKFENPSTETIKEYPNGCPLWRNSFFVSNITKKDLKGMPKALLEKVEILANENADIYLNYTGFLN